MTLVTLGDLNLSDLRWPQVIKSDLAQPTLVVSGAAPVPWFTGGQHIQPCCFRGSSTIDGQLQAAACMYKEMTFHILSVPIVF